MRRIVILTALILTLMIVPASIYALVNPWNSTGIKTPEGIAIDFIKGSPTFKFDGITSSLIVDGIYLNKSYPPQYVVTLSFQCMHSGYGDRAGKFLLQVITPHTAVVAIKDGKVYSAVLDGVWDEMSQKNVVDQGKLYAETIARNWLINAPTFKFDGVEGSVEIVNSWLAMTFAAPSFWGVEIEFDCAQVGYGDRTGQMLAEVITHHTVIIHVTEGVVTLAQIDNIWDELKQEFTSNNYTAESAEQTALEWLYSCPTFKFDGIMETVKVEAVEPLRTPYAWDVVIDFTCNYPSYGDRTGNVMYGPSQSHTIRITVIKGQVNRAIIDKVWDEMKQSMIGEDSPVLSDEEARDIIVRYLIDKLRLNARAHVCVWGG